MLPVSKKPSNYGLLSSELAASKSSGLSKLLKNKFFIFGATGVIVVVVILFLLFRGGEEAVPPAVEPTDQGPAPAQPIGPGVTPTIPTAPDATDKDGGGGGGSGGGGAGGGGTQDQQPVIDTELTCKSEDDDSPLGKEYVKGTCEVSSTKKEDSCVEAVPEGVGAAVFSVGDTLLKSISGAFTKVTGNAINDVVTVSGKKYKLVAESMQVLEYVCESDSCVAKVIDCGELGCEGGACLSKEVEGADICDPGSKKCEGNKLKTCKADGSGWAEEACEFGCEANACKVALGCVATGADSNCNGLDEDCSGTPDNSYIPTQTTCGDGICASSGQVICANGVEQDSCIEDLSKAVPELCDGEDNDCDSIRDNGWDALCDNNNVCDGAETCGAGLGCQAGIPMTCDDQNECTDNTCDPTAGCVFTNNQNPCNDNDLCTENDVCNSGICQGNDLSTDDGFDCTLDSCDLVNGLQHVPNNLACDDGNICTDNVCSATDGCVFTNNAAQCNDENLCTIGDICQAGTCQAGTQKDCSTFDDSCNKGICDSNTGECVKDPNPLDSHTCDDSNLCTESDVCLAGVCGGVLVTCPEIAECNPDSGQCEIMENGEDGFGVSCIVGPDGQLICGSEGRSVLGMATRAAGKTCTHIGKECTFKEGSCRTARGYICADKTGAYCELKPYGSGGREICVTPGSTQDYFIVCREPNDYGHKGTVWNTMSPPYKFEDYCEQSVLFNYYCGTSGVAIDEHTCGTSCLDGVCTLCKISDKISDLKCSVDGLYQCSDDGSEWGLKETCDDSLDCTIDTCDDSTKSCAHTPDDAKCNDGNLCNGVEVCSMGSGCQPGQELSCDDQNSCTEDSCDNLVGCAHNSVSCDDGNACTMDTCDSVEGCKHEPIVCDDGQFCNGVEECDPLIGCINSAPADVDDGIDCTIDTCDELTDMLLHTPDNLKCDNNLFCDGIEVCSAGLGCVSAGDAPDCSPYECDETTNKCQVCEPGQAQCSADGTSLSTCSADGFTLSEASCSKGCGLGPDGQNACYECDPGVETKCEGNSLVKCSDGTEGIKGFDWILQKCLDNKGNAIGCTLDVDNQGVCRVCNPGSTVCMCITSFSEVDKPCVDYQNIVLEYDSDIYSYVNTCNSEGTGWEIGVSECPFSYAPAGSRMSDFLRCGASLQGEDTCFACTPGEVKCDEQGNNLLKCIDDLSNPARGFSWETVDSCEGYGCGNFGIPEEQDRCKTCEEGAVTCNEDGKLYQCSDGFNKLPANDCQGKGCNTDTNECNVCAPEEKKCGVISGNNNVVGNCYAGVWTHSGDNCNFGCDVATGNCICPEGFSYDSTSNQCQTPEGKTCIDLSKPCTYYDGACRTSIGGICKGPQGQACSEFRLNNVKYCAIPGALDDYKMAESEICRDTIVIGQHDYKSTVIATNEESASYKFEDYCLNGKELVDYSCDSASRQLSEQVVTCDTSCSDGACTMCSPGSKRCAEGGSIEVCSQDGAKWEFSESCLGVILVCDSSESNCRELTSGCGDNPNTPEEDAKCFSCIPGGAKCDEQGNNLLKCIDDLSNPARGFSWDTEYCAYGCGNPGGFGIQNNCKTCEENKITCKSDGMLYWCPNGFSEIMTDDCQGKGCNTDTNECNVCTPEEKKCGMLSDDDNTDIYEPGIVAECTSEMNWAPTEVYCVHGCDRETGLCMCPEEFEYSEIKGACISSSTGSICVEDPTDVNDKTVKGVTKTGALQYGEEFVHEDICIDDIVLKEYYCRTKDELGEIFYDCDYGCSDGVCKSCAEGTGVCTADGNVNTCVDGFTSQETDCLGNGCTELSPTEAKCNECVEGEERCGEYTFSVQNPLIPGEPVTYHDESATRAEKCVEGMWITKTSEHCDKYGYNCEMKDGVAECPVRCSNDIDCPDHPCELIETPDVEVLCRCDTNTGLCVENPLDHFLDGIDECADDSDCQEGATCVLKQQYNFGGILAHTVCSCMPEYSFKCDNGNVYWTDSCGQLGSIKEECVYGCEGDMCKQDAFLGADMACQSVYVSVPLGWNAEGNILETIPVTSYNFEDNVIGSGDLIKFGADMYQCKNNQRCSWQKRACCTYSKTEKKWTNCEQPSQDQLVGKTCVPPERGIYWDTNWCSVSGKQEGCSEMLVEDCEASCDMSSGEPVCISCEPNAYKRCRYNNVYWQDSCFRWEELAESCEYGCNDWTDQCYDPEAFTGCKSDNEVWYMNERLEWTKPKEPNKGLCEPGYECSASYDLGPSNEIVGSHASCEKLPTKCRIDSSGKWSLWYAKDNYLEDGSYVSTTWIQKIESCILGCHEDHATTLYPCGSTSTNSFAKNYCNIAAAAQGQGQCCEENSLLCVTVSPEASAVEFITCKTDSFPEAVVVTDERPEAYCYAEDEIHIGCSIDGNLRYLDTGGNWGSIAVNCQRGCGEDVNDAYCCESDASSECVNGNQVIKDKCGQVMETADCKDGGCEDGVCLINPGINSPTCIDSDWADAEIRGKDYYTKGETIHQGAVELVYGTDECNDNGVFSDSVLLEHYCENGAHKSERINCDYGCYNGACLSSPCDIYSCPEGYVCNNQGACIFDMYTSGGCGVHGFGDIYGLYQTPGTVLVLDGDWYLCREPLHCAEELKSCCTVSYQEDVTLLEDCHRPTANEKLRKICYDGDLYWALYDSIGYPKQEAKIQTCSICIEPGDESDAYCCPEGTLPIEGVCSAGEFVGQRASVITTNFVTGERQNGEVINQETLGQVVQIGNNAYQCGIDDRPYAYASHKACCKNYNDGKYSDCVFPNEEQRLGMTCAFTEDKDMISWSYFPLDIESKIVDCGKCEMVDGLPVCGEEVVEEVDLGPAPVLSSYFTSQSEWKSCTNGAKTINVYPGHISDTDALLATPLYTQSYELPFFETYCQDRGYVRGTNECYFQDSPALWWHGYYITSQSGILTFNKGTLFRNIVAPYAAITKIKCVRFVPTAPLTGSVVQSFTTQEVANNILAQALNKLVVLSYFL